MATILLQGGTLIDGSGAPPSPGNVLIQGERIAQVGVFVWPSNAKIIDCSDLIVAPGFIDGHSHSDLQVLQNRPEKLRQGVTTEVVGNCGFSPYPASPNRQELNEFANGIFHGEGNWGWPVARDYLKACRQANVHVLSLVGHGTLRLWAAGNKARGPLCERDLDRMEKKLDEALVEGACGLSTGLMYSPGAEASVKELKRLCQVVAKRDMVYATHLRNYSAGLVDAVEEQIRLAECTGCRLQISHFQAVGTDHWPEQQPALEKIEEASARGVDIAFDCYPYIAGSTVLTQILPQWSLLGGIRGLLERLGDPYQRGKIATETEEHLAQGWNNLFISSVASSINSGLVGQSIAAISELRSCEPVEVVLDLLTEEAGLVNILEINQSLDNLHQTISHPLANIVSDGFYVTGRPHPRLYGTFPHLLGEMSRERKWLSLAEAIYRITGRPAQRFGIKDRGRLAQGYYADITVFDAATIRSPATYEMPTLPPLGIKHVLRHGSLQATVLLEDKA